MSGALSGFRVVILGVNVPAMVVGARLASFGAHVTKIESPAGDPTEHAAADWYRDASVGIDVRKVDLKADAGKAEVAELVADADVLVTVMRPSAVERLGFGYAALAAKHPELVYVAITGFPTPRENVAGHDLTYQAELGLLTPPALPRVLVADLAGSERTVSAVTALLAGRGRGNAERFAEVALSESAEAFAVGHRYGVTAPGGVAGGADVLYGLFEAADGWIAVAALETHFRTRLLSQLGLDREDRTELAAIFRTRGAREWQEWAEGLDLPIAAVAG